MAKSPEASQDLSEAGIRANIEYLMGRQAKCLQDNFSDKDELAQQMAKLDQLSKQP